METKSYLELLFNDSPNPYYFAEYDTHNIVFVNNSMEKKLRAYDDVVGKKCYQVIHNRESPCHFCLMDSLKESEFTEQRIFSEVTRSYHRANSTTMTVNGKKLCACKYFVAFPQERQVEFTIPYDKAIEKVIKILEEYEVEKAIFQLLALLGEYYHCRRSFIYELDPSKQEFSSTCTWLKDENDTEIASISDLSMVQTFLQWLDHMEGEPTEISKSITYLDKSIERQLLSYYKINNLSVHPINNRVGKVIGFLGLTDRKKVNFDPRLMKAIARFIEEKNSTDIVLSELKAVSSLDNQTGFYNRKSYMESLRHMQEVPPVSLGVVFVRLTNLRAVNEKIGFAEGDLHILHASTFLKSHFTEPFYRITGDEFLAFVPNIKEGDFFQRVTALEEHLKKDSSPVMEIGCAWDNSEDMKVLQIVADADHNIHSNF